MSHDTYTRVINGAGQRNYVAHCSTCNRAVGKQTTDRARAEQDANDHAMAPVRAVTS